MEVIKIRAWDNVEKKFCTFLSVGEKSGEGSVQFFGNEQDELEIGRLEEFDTGMGINDEFTPFPKYLYTGLKDKNGVEIYKGDILSAFYGTQLTEVSWNAEFGLYEVALQLSGGSEATDELLGNHLGVVEVIGNIYENPELLEAKL